MAASIALALAFSLALAAQASAFIFWTDPTNGTIGRASIDGAGLEPNLVTGLNEPCGVTTDGTWIYWATTGDGNIGRARLDGSQANPSFITGGGAPCGPSIELLGDELFWAEPSLNPSSVASADSNGANVNPFFVEVSEQSPEATATLGSSVYWTDGFGNTIQFSNTAGDQFATVNSSAVDDPFGGIAVSGQDIYWINDSRTSGAAIAHVESDGSNPNASLVSTPFACGIGADANHVYWSVGGAIGRADLDGTSPDPSFIPATGAAPCQNLAIIPDTAEASASPTSIAFGGRQSDSGPSAPQDVTVKNSASTSVDLTPDDSTLSGQGAGDFVITNDGCTGQTIAPGGTCTVSVAFDPQSLGGRRATLSIPSNDPNSPDTVTLTGTGTDPDQTVSPASISFANRLVGTTSQPATVTLTNEATATQADQIGQAAISGGGGSFGIVDDGCSNTTVAIGDSCQITVDFAPASAGVKDGQLNIASDDPTSPATVALSGTGTVPQEAVNPADLAFGDQQAGTASGTQSITVENLTDATGPLVLGTVTLGGADAGQFDRVFDGCSGRTLAPGQDCSVGVRFAPSSAGARSAAVQITSNDSGGTVSVGLSGTGTNPAPPTNAFSLGKVTRKPNGKASVPVTIPGAGQLQLSGKGIKARSQSASGPGTVTLQIAPNSSSLKRLKRGKRVRVVVKVTFTPTGGQPASHFAVVRLARPRVG